MVAKGLTKFMVSIIGGIGSILFLLGIFYLASTGKADFAIIGLVLILMTEGFGIYMAKYESTKEIDVFRMNILQMIGTAFAFPVLLFILYLFSPDKFLLIFSIALTAGALIKTIAIIAKAIYIERNC